MGSEENLCRCPSSGVVNVHSNCTTMRDAGVVCKGEWWRGEGGREGEER